jgi:type IV secretory pathway TrbD component
MRYHEPVNNALNKSKLKGGLPWKIWLACVIVGVFVVALISIPLGILMLLGLPSVMILVFKKDERIMQIAACTIAQKAYYEPGKSKTL